MAGKSAVFDGLDRTGFEDPQRSLLQARLTLQGELMLSVHVSADASRGADFDLANAGTVDWFLCSIDRNNPRSCRWRVGLAECDATQTSTAVRTVRLKDVGEVSFEVARRYTSLSDLSRVVRAFGSVSGYAFDETSYFRLLKDSYDANYADERLAVLFPPATGLGCGFALEAAANELPAVAYLFDCNFDRTRTLEIESIVDSASAP
jgi:hypothetical protein